MSITDDMFTVFISHKHDDHALAVEVKKAMEGLSPRSSTASCPASTSRRAWTGGARSAASSPGATSSCLLFTAPSKNWDWCLYETGLYTRFDRTEVRSVVCLFNPGQASPSPLADLQGVPADADKVRAFLDPLCRQTWKMSDDWRRGALAPEIADDQVEAAARAIAEAFRRSGSASTYYPCHRVVLSLSESDDIASGIPESARVMEGPNDTSGYTMSLFDLAGGTGKRTWGDLLRAVDGTEAAWRRELDSHFLQALDEQLFPPMEGRMRAGGTSRGQERLYRPDPLQHRSRADGRASVGRCRRDRPAAPLRDHRLRARAAGSARDRERLVVGCRVGPLSPMCSAFAVRSRVRGGCVPGHYAIRSDAPKIPTITNTIATFATVPASIPSQVATPTRPARSASRCAMSSPIAAPTSGMKTSPTKPVNTPTTVSMTPSRLAPARFAPAAAATS